MSQSNRTFSNFLAKTDDYMVLEVISNVLKASERVFQQEPTLGSLGEYKDFGISFLKENEPWTLPFSDAKRTLGHFIEEIDASKDIDKLIEDLSVEYASLFYGISDAPIFPIESVRMGSEHTLYESPFFEVTRFYDKQGFLGILGYEEPNDHVSVELECLAWLLDQKLSPAEMKDANSLNEISESINWLLNNHVMKWIPKFCDEVIAHSQFDYYKSAAYLVKALLSMNNDK